MAVLVINKEEEKIRKPENQKNIDMNVFFGKFTGKKLYKYKSLSLSNTNLH